ncbi:MULTISPECIES: pyridoxal phosphate-dependent aminotransferase [Brochothrix]|uniref:Aminotransferase n=1 Tax=Brochothrix thermosphacta TaxID=2756 RepID=A0A1D2K806_BROTH|nr:MULTISPECIES: pyridoxal phosphate-dependent aminotransferase [Brochothrix]SLM90037.1 Aspartate aminotransferase [Brachybacterium faecium]ANZ94363.1 aspartate aminotransferase [Brochothrix thermosphacta]ATF26771.1 pyridoxal phosphate-dependent aminotransferase [Brochothrix thermosphacta]ATH86128.1 pyridoxal phosphate-dependent aminotransferase [Brochothrix thermosphacta]EUJ37064.1 aspartate aminotransferase [Brochothrix thermosphacta DSM 20171 = FSL F6-1036]
MTFELSKRALNITPSATLVISGKAKEMKASGIDVIGLGAGEPDFNTPDYILDAAKAAMDNGETKYTAVGGIIELKQAIVDKLAIDNGLTYTTNQVIVTTGAKNAIYTLCQAVLNAGDEVIIPAPYWVSYTEMVKLAEGVPVIIEGKQEQQFKVTAAEIEAAITPKTRALFINSPSNPTGTVYSREELQAIAEVAVKHQIMVISDEIYEKLIFGEAEHISIASLGDEIKQLTMIINGVSKSHAMTGWRIGYAVGDAQVIKAMTELNGHATSNPTSIAQYAALGAYTGDQTAISVMKEAFGKRLDTIYPQITAIPGFKVDKPSGAFYLFIEVSEAAKQTGFDSVDAFATALLEEAHVAVIPGSGFGTPNYIRISYATSLELLEEAVKRMKNFVISKQH